MGLRHHHDRQQVVVTASPAVLLPGDPVTVSVAVTGDPDDKVRDARVVLRRIEHYREFEIGAYVDYNAGRENVAVVAEAPFDATAAHTAVTFVVPADALPSAAEAVEWEVQAVIERHHGLNSRGKVPVTVLAPLRADASAATGPALVKGEPWFDVVVDERNVRPGDTVTGRIVVAPFAPVDHYGNLMLGFNLVDGRDDDRQCFLGAHYTSFMDTVPGSPDPQEFPFELTVPGDAPPTVDGRTLDPPRPVQAILSVRVNTWRTTGIADNSVAVELNVYNHPPTPDPDATHLK